MSAPVIVSVTDNVGSQQGRVAPRGRTDDPTLALAGTAIRGSTVSIWNGTTLLGTTTANAITGAWTFTTVRRQII
jgi:hypothetical protein